MAGVNAVRRVLPGVLKALGQRAELVEKGRRATADLFAGVIKRYSFASRDVDPAVARFAERMIESTPIDVVAEYYPAFDDHDKAEALAHFRDMPVLVLAGVGISSPRVSTARASPICCPGPSWCSCRTPGTW